MEMSEFDTFDFLINDEDEVMLLLYAREGEPENAVIDVDFENKTAVLIRKENDGIELQEIPDDVLDALSEADKILVCELCQASDDEDAEVVYAYEAEIQD